MYDIINFNGVIAVSKNRNKIENFTIKEIKRDIKGNIISLIVVAIIFAVFSLAFLGLALFKKNTNIVECVWWFFSLLTASVAVSTLIAALYAYKKRKSIKIFTDVLTEKNIEQKKILGIPKEPKFNFIFENNGQYTIPEQLYGEKNYKWSKFYNISNTKLYDSSDIDDEFYIVASGGKKAKILLIYNKKYFEFQEN